MHGPIVINTTVPPVVEYDAKTGVAKIYLSGKEEDYIDAREACRVLHLKSHKTLYRYVANRALPATKSGKSLIFKRSEIESWIRKYRTQQ